jgi:asparagine synthase (glutamine-hydrolysing)
MCGICGKVSAETINPEVLQRMNQAIAHRGPDDEGFYLKGKVGLGSRRLSIIDLNSGQMPICNEDHTIWIVYNGEIYNYQPLRQWLEQQGHIFKTNTDTEVIVHLYEELGERCVEQLNGMFAFAIWDEKTQKLVLARDRIGQKPLFYAQDGHNFWFASEVKSILASREVKREIDLESIHHYLSLRFIPAPRTMLQNIRKLPPAHYLVFQDGNLSIVRYWNLHFQEKWGLSEEELVDGLNGKLNEAVKSHLISDVPIGAFLSGGMDSSMVVAMMARNLSIPFKTFSIGVKEQDFNELPYARLVAEQYGTCHIEQYVEFNLIKLLPQIIWHLDEPSDPIAACMFHAAHLASRHVKVVLGGDGGDELFAGFDRYLGVGFIDRYNLIPAFFRHKILGPLINSAPDSFTYKSITQKLRWVHQLSLLPDPGSKYAEATCFFRFNQEDKRQLYSDTLWRQMHGNNSANVIAGQYDVANADDPLDRMLYADFMTRLPEHTLMLTDRMTMAHSLEARSPFLDHTLVEYMAAFPSKMKIRDKTLKYILRCLAAEYLPEKIVHREKQGFMFPVAYWFQNELHPFINQLLPNSHFVRAGLFKKESVQSLIEDHQSKRVDNHVRLWMLLNLEIWHQLYIAQSSIESIEESIQSRLMQGSGGR